MIRSDTDDCIYPTGGQDCRWHLAGSGYRNDTDAAAGSADDRGINAGGERRNSDGA
jgi:hypothetical protein